jgi:hypothetical protein
MTDCARRIARHSDYSLLIRESGCAGEAIASATWSGRVSSALRTRVENHHGSCWTAFRRWSEADAVAEASEFPDHLGRATFVIHDAVVQNLPDQTTEPMGDRANGLRVPQADHEPSIHDLKDTAFGLDGGRPDLRDDLLRGIDPQPRARGAEDGISPATRASRSECLIPSTNATQEARSHGRNWVYNRSHPRSDITIAVRT